MSLITVLVVLVIVIFWTTFMLFCLHATKSKPLEQKIDTVHVNEHSFQNYAKFYGEIFPSDKDFDYKLNKIYIMISDHHMMDIKKIADLSSCTVPECVTKIRYLKNKRLLGDYYIDTVHLQLLPCSEQDQKLLDKYKPFIYGSHAQVVDIANQIANPNYLDTVSLRREVLEELKYLDSKGLLNGIKIDDIDGHIWYYTIEKRKTNVDYESVHCPNCGALNDVEVHGKVRCDYCHAIIKGKLFNDGF